MSWLQFISSLVDALVWPGLIGFVLYVYRKPISKLLVTGLKRLKAGPIEIEWDLAALETRADLEATKAIEAAESTEKPDVLQSLLEAVQNAKRAFSQDRPVLAIFAAYRAVELALASVLDVQPPQDSDDELGAAELVAAGRVLGHVAPTTRRAVLRLREMRNLAAHDQAVTSQQAEEFCDLAALVIEQLQAVREAKDK